MVGIKIVRLSNHGAIATNLSLFEDFTKKSLSVRDRFIVNFKFEPDD